MALVKGTNSYVSLLEAEEYFADRFSSDNWINATVDEKNQALIAATAYIDSKKFTGTVVSATQPLAFPREGSYYDPKARSDIDFDESTPDRIIKATYEMAYHLLSNTELFDDTGSVKEIKVDTIAIKYVQPPPKQNSLVSNLLSPMLVNGGSNLWWRAN